MTVTLALVAAAASIGPVHALAPDHAAIEQVRGAWADRWGDALAGGVVAAVGIVVMSLGI